MSASPLREFAMQEAFREQEIILAFKEAAILQAAQNAPVTRDEGGGYLLPRFIHPYLKWSGEYNDNIFLIHENVQKDIVNKFSPGVVVSFTELNPSAQRDNRVLLDLGVNLDYYSRYDHLNGEYPYGKLLVDLGGKRNKLHLSQAYEKNYALNSSLVSGSSGISNFHKSDTRFGWESAFNRFGFNVEGARWYQEYMKDEFKSQSTYEEQMYAGSVFLQAFPKTRFFLGYNFGWIDYPKRTFKGLNNHYERVWLGVRGMISRKISGLIKIGTESRNYKDDVDSQNDIAYSIDLNYKATRKTLWKLQFSKGNKDPSYVKESFDKGIDTAIGFSYRFNNHLSWSANGSFSKDRYASSRKDNSHSLSHRLDYTYSKWLRLYLGYRYRWRDSNEVTSEYVNNIGELGGALVF